MPSCEYCDKSFTTEKRYLKHLKKNHYDEIGRIQKQKVDALESDEKTSLSMIIAVAVVALSIIGVFAYILLIQGGGAAQVGNSPMHQHGTINVTVNDEPIDFSQQKYIELDRYFHFHGEDDLGDRYQIHIEDREVTVEYAINTFPNMEISPSGDEITINGETYRESDPGTNISVTVNGEEVTPGEYRLRGVRGTGNISKTGDHLKIVVESEQ